MRNRSPIILNCFSRGGSNILWNILLSHPEVCSPMQETLEIFRLDLRDMRWSGLQAAWLTRQFHFFDQWNIQSRAPISNAAQDFIDQTLFQWKLKTLEDEEMRHKALGAVYTAGEVAQARLALKNNNGLLFLSERFLEMYPDAVFLCLVRDPVPLYESHKRHKTPVSTSPEAFTKFYEEMVCQMERDRVRWRTSHILRFEDILCEPLKWIQTIYEWAGLDAAQVPKIRFKAKPHMQADGTHGTRYQAGRHYWFSYEEIPQILEPEVNSYQISKLGAGELDRIRTLTSNVRSRLGYANQ